MQEDQDKQYKRISISMPLTLRKSDVINWTYPNSYPDGTRVRVTFSPGDMGETMIFHGNQIVSNEEFQRRQMKWMLMTRRAEQLDVLDLFTKLWNSPSPEDKEIAIKILNDNELEKIIKYTKY